MFLDEELALYPQKPHVSALFLSHRVGIPCPRFFKSLHPYMTGAKTRKKKEMFSENGMSQRINITSCSIFIMCNNLTYREFRLITLSPGKSFPSERVIYMRYRLERSFLQVFFYRQLKIMTFNTVSKVNRCSRIFWTPSLSVLFNVGVFFIKKLCFVGHQCSVKVIRKLTVGPLFVLPAVCWL